MNIGIFQINPSLLLSILSGRPIVGCTSNVPHVAFPFNCASQAYPLLNHKPALMRAYKMTISKKGGGDGDDWVQKHEFKRLLANQGYRHA